MARTSYLLDNWKEYLLRQAHKVRQQGVELNDPRAKGAFERIAQGYEQLAHEITAARSDDRSRFYRPA
jgi:hypothetical protein